MFRLRASRFVTTVACVALFASAVPATDWYVRPDGSNANAGTGATAALAFATIQHAVDTAVSGDTIRVAAGTYVEQVVIRDKSLELFGGVAMPGIPASTTTIQMPASRAIDASKKLSNTIAPIVNSSIQADPCVWVEDTTPSTADVEVYFSRFTVDGASLGDTAGGPAFVGIVYRAARGEIVYCNVNNFQDPTPNGFQRGAGIWIDGDSSFEGATNVRVYRTSTCNIQKGHLIAKVGTANFVNCTCRGYGPVGFISQNGVQFSSNVRGGLHGCNIFGFEFTGGTFSSSGVLVFAPTRRLRMTGNHISGCDVGMNIDDGSDFGPTSPIGTNYVEANTIEDCAFVNLFTEAQGTGLYRGNRLLNARIAGSLAEDFGPSVGPNTWRHNIYDDIVVPGPRLVGGSASVSDSDARVQPASFQAPASIDTAQSDPTGVVARDFNGDGYVDVAFVNNTGDNVRVWYGNGAGAFPLGQTVSLPGGSAPTAIATGNLNGDTAPDLAVACANGTVVTVLNNLGGVAFPAAATAATILGTGISASESPSAIAVGDVDGANRDDILVSLAGTAPAVLGGARLLTNTGTGTSFVGSAPFGLIGSSRGCALGDIDLDGDLDAVVTDAGLNAPTSLLNVHTYRNIAGLFIAGPVLTGGLGPRGVTIDNLDGLDAPEIICANFGNPPLVTGSVSVFPNTSTPAGFSIAPAVTTNTDQGAHAVVAGDFLGDRNDGPVHRDVAVINLVGGTITLLQDWRSHKISSGSGAFGRTATITAPSAPAGIALADLNRDVAADLVVCDTTTDTVDWYRGDNHAVLAYFGQGCRGANGVAPIVLTEGGHALLSNPDFAIAIDNARPGATAFLVGSLARVNPVPENCAILVTLINVFFPTTTNGSGFAKLPIPLPAGPPVIVGFNIYWQWGVFDPGAEFAGTAAITNAMRTVLGR